MTVRARLLLTSLAILAAGLAVLLLAGNLLLARRVGDEASGLLRARAEAQLATLDIRGSTITVREAPNDQQLDKRAWVVQGSRVIERPVAAPPALDRAAIRLGRAGRPAEREGIEDVRLRAAPVQVPGRGRIGAVVVALDVGPLERLQQEVLVGSLVFAALVLLAGAVATRRVLDGALRPVERMTESAEAWIATDLEHRFGLGPARDELTGLAATLDHLLERIAASRRHEQRFASEAAHELRTPVAGLRARAELALGATGADAEAERMQALEAVMTQADRLDRTVESLLAIARQELDPSAGAADLAALAREHVDRDAEPAVEVRVAGVVPPAEGEPEVVRRALAPLVENARTHARSHVVLEVSAGDGRARVVVRDDGPGLDPAVGERAFEPGARGPGAGERGAGLGLPLARRLARSCGGDVLAGDQGDGGCFVLDLPALPGSQVAARSGGHPGFP